MSRIHSPHIPFLLFSLFCSAFLGIVEEISVEARAEQPEAAWQDPFYTGPFGVRTWTDVTGDHRVEGRFVELLPEKVVRLQKPDGRFLRIQLDQLSQADRKLVREIVPQ